MCACARARVRACARVRVCACARVCARWTPRSGRGRNPISTGLLRFQAGSNVAQQLATAHGERSTSRTRRPQHAGRGGTRSAAKGAGRAQRACMMQMAGRGVLVDMVPPPRCAGRGGGRGTCGAPSRALPWRNRRVGARGGGAAGTTTARSSGKDGRGDFERAPAGHAARTRDAARGGSDDKRGCGCWVLDAWVLCSAPAAAAGEAATARTGKCAHTSAGAFGDTSTSFIVLPSRPADILAPTDRSSSILRIYPVEFVENRHTN